MNLSAKSTIFFLFFLLLYISCDESSEVGLELEDQDNSLEAKYIDIPLTASNIFLDSVRTDYGSLIFGQYDNPVFGKTKAVGYSQFSPEIISPDVVTTDLSIQPADSSILDSIKLFLSYSYIHGEEFDQEQEVSVRLIEDTLFSSAIYLSSKTIPLVTNKAPVGFTRFTVDKPGDTLLTIPLTMNYGNILLDLARQGVSDREIRESTKGIAFEPGVNNKLILGFDLSNEFSRIVLYYHNSVDDTVSNQYRLRFDSPLSKHYSNYSTDRSASALSSVEIKNLNEFSINDKIYWQSGSGIYPMIDLSGFTNFIDTAKNVILNKVELSMGPVDNSEKKYINPPNTAIYYFAKEDNNINSSGIESTPMSNVILKDNAYYGQDEDPAYYAYDSLISHTYKGTSTVFFQDLALKKYDVKKVVVFPSTPSTFNQAIIDKTKFRLKVFYSKL